MIRTLIADNVVLIRVGLIALLTMEPDIEVVAELDRLEPVAQVASAAQPDVALVDCGHGGT